MKLFRLKLRGMETGIIAYGYPYVVAENMDEAYKKVRNYLDEKDLGFENDREMESIQLLAETGDYPNCGVQLFL
jgi:hypothetical protein